MNDVFWGICVRTCQAGIEAAATVFCGLLVVGIMRRMLGAKGVQRMFGGEGFSGLIRAWIVGTLLPVCSFGVIPIAYEMRRCGVRSGTVLAFVLAAPQLNPLSLLYGLTLSEPLVIVCFAILSLFMAVAAGAVWDYLLASPTDQPPAEPDQLPPPGLKRMFAVLTTASVESTKSLAWFILIGILLNGIVSGSIPNGGLSHTMRHDDKTSPLLMTALATPLYSGPLQGMMRLGLIFEHGNSTGAAFALFELGIGVNFGLYIWMSTLYGIRRVSMWFLAIMVMTTALAYIAEPLLYFAHEEASHTHAFDDWSNPFASGGGHWDTARDKIVQKIEVLESFSLTCLAGMFLLGIIIRWRDRQGQIENWLQRHPPENTKPTSVWNRPLPGPVLGLAALAGLVVFSVAALYVYYPAPKAVFTEMAQVRTEALSAVMTGNREEAIRQLQHLDLLTRKLQVGIFIRTGKKDPTCAKLTEDCREELEELRDLLLANELAEAKKMIPKISASYRTMRESYDQTLTD